MIWWAYALAIAAAISCLGYGFGLARLIGIEVAIGDAGILGIYSLSENEPIKTGNFAREDEGLDQARTYADWKFTFVPPSAPAAPDNRTGVTKK